MDKFRRKFLVSFGTGIAVGSLLMILSIYAYMNTPTILENNTTNSTKTSVQQTSQSNKISDILKNNIISVFGINNYQNNGNAYIIQTEYGKIFIPTELGSYSYNVDVYTNNEKCSLYPPNKGIITLDNIINISRSYNGNSYLIYYNNGQDNFQIIGQNILINKNAQVLYGIGYISAEKLQNLLTDGYGVILTDYQTTYNYNNYKGDWGYIPNFGDGSVRIFNIDHNKKVVLMNNSNLLLNQLGQPNPGQYGIYPLVLFDSYNVVDYTDINNKQVKAIFPENPEYITFVAPNNLGYLLNNFIMKIGNELKSEGYNPYDFNSY